MKIMYAKYCIPHDISPDDVSWFRLTFSTRAELEIMNPYMSVYTAAGRLCRVGSRKDTNACFHFDDDVLIFLIKFPNAFLLEYNEMHNDY